MLIWADWAGSTSLFFIGSSTCYCNRLHDLSFTIIISSHNWSVKFFACRVKYSTPMILIVLNLELPDFIALFFFLISSSLHFLFILFFFFFVTCSIVMTVQPYMQWIPVKKDMNTLADNQQVQENVVWYNFLLSVWLLWSYFTWNLIS